MLLITLQIVLLLIAIIIPISARKNKAKTKFQQKPYKIDTNTRDAMYAINENGSLEKIHRADLTGRSSQLDY